MRGHAVAGSRAEDADHRLAFDRLYDTHARAVLAYALRRTASADGAGGAASWTFIVAWRRLARVLGVDEALPWLFGVARKVLANQRRAAARRGRLINRIAEQPQAGAGLTLGAGGTPALAALERLGADDQELLRLVAWEGLSHAEIAVVLGITVNAVAIRLHRARGRYREAHAGLATKGSLASRTVAAVRGRMFGFAGRNEAT